MEDIRVEDTPAITELLATAGRVACRATAVHTQPRAMAVAIRVLRAAVDIRLAAEAGILPVEGEDIPPVAAAILVEAITKRKNELL